MQSFGEIEAGVPPGMGVSGFTKVPLSLSLLQPSRTWPGRLVAQLQGQEVRADVQRLAGPGDAANPRLATHELGLSDCQSSLLRTHPVLQVGVPPEPQVPRMESLYYHH